MLETRRGQWRAARARARERARREGRCIGCLRTPVGAGRVTCAACGQRANAAKGRREKRLRSSAVARAEAFGIDVGMLLRNGRLSPEQRFASLERTLQDARALADVVRHAS